MSDVKTNTVSSNCPSFYKEKIKDSHKGSRLSGTVKKFFEKLRGKN